MPKKKRRVITEGATAHGSRERTGVRLHIFLVSTRSHGPYPIKVGMTRAGSAEHRIAQQIGASNAETPILLLEISCENASLLERSLHSRLKSRHISDVPGKEWFRTTPGGNHSTLARVRPFSRREFWSSSDGFSGLGLALHMLANLGILAVTLMGMENLGQNKASKAHAATKAPY